MIIVMFQHPTQFFDDSYAVNSANNGPYGDAIMQELIPEVERRFRIIKKPYARVLSGGSTGGWESLALQLYHPEFFGGTWTFFPDPIDFRRYGLVDIYADSNYYTQPNAVPGAPERMMEMNSPDGQPLVTNRWIEQMEYAIGTHGAVASRSWTSGTRCMARSATMGIPSGCSIPRPASSTTRSRTTCATTATISATTCTRTGRRSGRSSSASCTSWSATWTISISPSRCT